MSESSDSRLLCMGVNDECWLWPGSIDRDGYGRLIIDGRRRQAHRWLYEKIAGPIPDGLVTDHLCRNRDCVNPTHIEPVTIRENTMRGFGQCALNARKTKCDNGHAFTEANTYIRPDGSRDCRVCVRDRKRRSRENLKLRAA